MVNSVGSYTSPNVLPTVKVGGTSRAGLEAQLTRYKKEHSACVNCESAKTQSGKLNIQSLETKISQIESRIQEITPTKPTDDSAAVGPSTSQPTSTSLGIQVDVYA